MRLDAIPLKGGGYRLQVGFPRPYRTAFAAAELRPKNRGGVWFEIPLCERLIK
jgi:hypothetical protein